MNRPDIQQLYLKLLESRTVIIITGPTSSGKTSLSLQLAELIPSEIISADSRQFYKNLDIGTAKPANEELSKVKHHFINYLNPDEEYNAGRFGDEASITINDLFSKNLVPIVVGGSGLYIKSLTEGLFDEDVINDKSEIRIHLIEKLDKYGKKFLYDELALKDPQSARQYLDMNPRRVLRALEYFYLTGESIVSSRQKNKIKRNFNFVQFGVNFERSELYRIINERVLGMWKSGLVKELSNILKLGYSPELNSLNTVGYKETYLYLTGYLSEDETIAEIQKNTRRFAKRQMTWFKKDSSINWINHSNDTSIIVDELLNILAKQIV